EELDPERSLGEVLLTPTRIYADPIVRLLRAYRVKKVVSGMAHITGGGLAGNLDRALHDRVDAVVDPNSWETPAVFRFLQQHGSVEEAEMRRVFNMGIGYCLIVRPSFAGSIERRLSKTGERVHRIGKIVKGRGRVRYRGERG
ncbi:MAG: AIR synthase-related protein, partial [Planctomycetota bacterium]